MPKSLYELTIPRDAGHELRIRILRDGECRLSVWREGKELQSHRVTLRLAELDTVAELLRRLAEVTGATAPAREAHATPGTKRATALVND